MPLHLNIRPFPILLYSQYNSCGEYFGVLRISRLLDFVHHLILKKHNLLETDLLPSTGEGEEASTLFVTTERAVLDCWTSFSFCMFLIISYWKKHCFRKWIGSVPFLRWSGEADVYFGRFITFQNSFIWLWNALGMKNIKNPTQNYTSLQLCNPGPSII